MTLSVVLLCCSCSVQQKRASEGVTPTVARVSDDNFRQYLLESGYVEPYKGNMKGFGFWVSRKEVVESTAGGRALQLIDCHKKDIKSLDGIELFGNFHGTGVVELENARCNLPPVRPRGNCRLCRNDRIRRSFFSTSHQGKNERKHKQDDAFHGTTP